MTSDRTSGANALHTAVRAFLLVAFLVLTIPLALRAQTGELRGHVTSRESGEPVLRATVALVGTKLGAVSDMHGEFTVRHVPPGRYTVRVTYLGYRTEEVADVAVADGVARLDVVLEAAAIRQADVVVHAKAGTGTESALLNERRKSANVSDGISAAQIRRLPDATGADALGRVTGLSIVGGRYANIRGSNERYNNTQLNGVTMVSTDPGKRSFSFDLVPSSLLENTIVAKTFTPNLPGDFSGGLVQLNTIDFPDQQSFRVSVSSSYVSGTTFNQMQLGPRGSTDYLGIDDGNRALPPDFPDTAKLTRNTGNYTPAQIAGYARELPNNYAIKSLAASPNMSAVLSYGDRFNVLGNDLGLVAALSYRNSYDRTDIIRYDTTLGSIAKYDYSGVQNSYSVLWGGILNMSYKLGDLHTISIRNTYNRTAEDQLTQVSGINNGDVENHPTVFQYLQRAFYSGQVGGDHVIPELNNLRVQWKGFGSLGYRDEPDLRRITYARSAGDSSQPLQTPLSPTLVNAYGVGRVYTNLDEDLAGFSGDATLPVGDVRIRFGGLGENKSRRVSTRSFSYMLSNKGIQLSTAALDTLFIPSHINPDSITIEESTSPSDKYSGESHLAAAYLMADAPFEIAEQRFRVIAGARMENSRVVVHTVDANAKPLIVDYPTKDVLPAASLIYEVSPIVNLRLAYSKTLARPDFREFARSVFYDFIADALTYGNAGLKRTVIANYDARFEIFPEPGELLAVSVFHKDFTDAIEEVALPTGSTQLEKTWENTNGVNTGVELEVRKSFGFIADALAPVSFSVNYTWLDSKLDLTSGQGKRQRRLQGQSPYIVNAGLYYDNADLGTSVNLAYNRIGERISSVSVAATPDLVEQPRDRVDFTISQSFLTNYEIKLSVKDILAQDVVFMEADRRARVDKQSPVVTLGITLKL
ncbi:MAG: carboxypeptidase-like regulatory domain-containing protein [Bacteroidetes bacterium]|nr:carboxypeptidase-like regulatory domain-containing protein [Bacteroidota bacterium]